MVVVSADGHIWCILVTTCCVDKIFGVNKEVSVITVMLFFCLVNMIPTHHCLECVLIFICHINLLSPGFDHHTFDTLAASALYMHAMDRRRGQVDIVGGGT